MPAGKLHIVAPRGMSAPVEKAVEAIARKEAKKVVAKNDQTKTINAGFTVNKQYLAISGVYYLHQDVFSLPEGSANSTALASPNRIGDRTKIKWLKN